VHETSGITDIATANSLPFLIAVAVGLFNCFFGYRILKATLALTGFVVGAAAGWNAAASLAPGNSTVAVIAAVVLGIIGAVLCVWLFFLGIFLLGAAAGVALAEAVSGGIGTQTQPILVLGLALILGIIAVIVQKFIIIFCTAFSGAYLVIAGGFGLLAGGQSPLPLWLSTQPADATRRFGLVALVLWLVLSIAGVVAQAGRGRKKPEPEK
jgi:hypothetical protein